MSTRKTLDENERLIHFLLKLGKVFIYIDNRIPLIGVISLYYQSA